jgi:gluconokinase
VGVPLDDEDRRPWIEDLNKLLRKWSNRGTSGVLACSTLKHVYRVHLPDGLPYENVALVWLDGPRELLLHRLATRKHEFMNANLLDSQMAELEPTTAAFRVGNDRPPIEVVQEILKYWSFRRADPDLEEAS